MIRPAKSAIDAKILDRAAGLFAQYGFDRTSLQQIAEALGYSKAGLLHYYASKRALFDAVLDAYEVRQQEMIAEVSRKPIGIERDRALVESTIDYSYNWPGMSALGRQLAREGVTDDPRIVGLGMAVISTLGIDLVAPDMQRLTRAFSALSGVNFMAEIAANMNMREELRSHIVAAAMDTLGHRDPAGANRP